MKKLLNSILIISIVNLILLVLTYCNVLFGVEGFNLINKCDTIVNRIRIDSIEYVI